VLHEPITLTEHAIDVPQLADDGLPEVLLLLLGEFLLRIVHDVLDRHHVLLQLIAEVLDLLEGQVGGEDGPSDLVLAFLDALGQRDLALAGEEGDAAHFTEIEAHRVFGAAHRAGGEVDGRVRRLVVVGLRLRLDLGGEPAAAALRGVHHLDVHRTEHHHDVVELIEGDDVLGQGVVHLVVGEEALLLAHRDQLVELLQLRFVCHAWCVSSMRFRVGGPGPTRVLPPRGVR
jgi:hypothetical protein